MGQSIRKKSQIDLQFIILSTSANLQLKCSSHEATANIVIH